MTLFDQVRTAFFVGLVPPDLAVPYVVLFRPQASPLGSPNSFGDVSGRWAVTAS